LVIGLGAMIGAGIFAALAPAAARPVPGCWSLWRLAAVVAYCNATSSARLAARYPASGGTYVYGRERLGDFWGYLAGWAFVVGKTASCAAMALTVGSYTWPDHAHAVAVAAVVALTAVNYAGMQKSAWLTRVVVAVVLAVLGAGRRRPDLDGGGRRRLDVGSDATVGGVLQAAGLLFFAFAGYARIATLGEEVRDPARTIPRAIPLALGLTLVVYAARGRRRPDAVLGPQRAGRRRRPAVGCRAGRGRGPAAGAGRAGRRRRRRARLAARADPRVSPAPPWPWPATGTCPTSWPPSTRASVPHRAELPWARWSRCSPRPPTYAARSASPPSASWPTTPSPTPPPGRSPGRGPSAPPRPRGRPGRLPGAGLHPARLVLGAALYGLRRITTGNNSSH
jgi:hypothetical protein